MNHSLQAWRKRAVFNGLLVLFLLYTLLVAVRLISTGFQLAIGEQAEALFTVATNPFLGLIVGMLATALIQSSSTRKCRHNYYQHHC